MQLNLRELNPREFFNKRIELVEIDYDAVNERIDQIIRRTLRDERHNHERRRQPKRKQVSRTFVDRYRAKLPRRLNSLFDRLKVRQRAQVVKDIFPDIYRRAKRIPIDILNLPTKLHFDMSPVITTIQHKGGLVEIRQ